MTARITQSIHDAYLARREAMAAELWHEHNTMDLTIGRPGEPQREGIARLMARLRHRWTATGRALDFDLTFPQFKPGMSTADYVRKAVTAKEFQRFAPLNKAPATLYEGGALDFMPVHEEIDDDDDTEPCPYHARDCAEVAR